MLDAIYQFNREFFLSPLDLDGIRLLQIGRTFCKKGTIVHTHIHSNLFELTLVTDGEGVIRSNGIPREVKRNDIYLSFPCETHKIESSFQKPLKFDYCAFNADHSEYREEFSRIMENYHSSEKRVIQDERILTLIGNAVDEFGSKQPESEKLLSLIFHQVMIYLIRDFKFISPEKQPKSATEAESLCLRMINYIDSHIYTMKKLDDLSDAMGYSYSYLSTLFKKTTLLTLSDYFHEKKLNIASMLILEDQLKITEIAEMLNYASVYSFSKVFRSRFKISPRAYRQRMLKTGHHERDEKGRIEFGSYLFGGKKPLDSNAKEKQ